jgi:hypothetical protein
LLDDPPHVAKFYDYGHHKLRSVKLPRRDVLSLDCDGDKLVAMMVGRKAPLIRVIPLR